MLEKRIKEIEEKQERIGEWSERTIQLEKKEESKEREREKRRNNITLSGGDMLRRDSPKETVEEVVNQMLGTKAEVEEAYWIKKKQRESIVVAKLGNWEQKREVMTKKNKLKDKQLCIDNDLMVNDRQEIESEDLKNGMTERKMEVQEKV